MNISVEDIPHLKDGTVVAVDLETHDPDLKTHGSGAIVGKGKVCGIALAWDDRKEYFPIRHKGGLTSNLPSKSGGNKCMLDIGSDTPCNSNAKSFKSPLYLLSSK